MPSTILQTTFIRALRPCQCWSASFSSAAVRQEGNAISDLFPRSSPQSRTATPPRQRPSNAPQTAGQGKGNQKIYKSIEKRLAQMDQRSLNRRQQIEALEQSGRAADIEKLVTRRWKAGDVYAPHDLSIRETQKWRTRGPPTIDAFDALNINPINEYKNFSMIAEYTTTMGRIKHSSETGLRPKNQRKLAKAIRRAIGIGLMPSVHKHPELLEWDLQKRRTRYPF